MKNTLQFAVGMIGTASSVFLYSVPIITFRRVIKKRSTESFSCLPYVVTLLNCLLYTFYATPLISFGLENIVVCVINGLGAVFELTYVIIFLVFSQPKSKKFAARMLVGVILIFSGVAGIALFGLRSQKNKKKLVGILGIVSSVLMYGSPLSIIKLVIKTKSVEFLPFSLSLFSFVNSCMWLVYGALGKDIYVESPNFLGIPFGMVQLLLHWVYRGGRERNADLEMDIQENSVTEKTADESKTAQKECSAI